MARWDRDFQKQLWIACSRDELFWINSFAFVFEPRENIVYPFVTWDFQDHCFGYLDQAIGRCDLAAEKSRDMGWSWMSITSIFYRWLFRPRQTFGLVSRTEDACDKTDDPDTLFWKLDFHYDMLPGWMQPERYRVKLSMKNVWNNSVCTGYSATGDVGRGGRKTAFYLDEAASWEIDKGHAAWASIQHVTNSRIMVSTPQGLAGVFANVMRKPNDEMIKVSTHWSEHPEKQKGCYYSINKELVIVDKEYKFPPDYPFILDGKLRSPWYDRECKRHPIPALIAQELDIDYGGSGFPFFSADAVRQHAKTYACDPFLRGELMYDRTDHSSNWRENSRGGLFLWINLTGDLEPPHNFNYAIGCDISAGVAGESSTNSVASVVNKVTGEKVAELVRNDLFPDKFADYVVALRKWFRGPDGDADLIWESNGPGHQFGKHIMQVSPHKVYYKQSEVQQSAKRTKNPGWHSGKTEKRIILGEYGKAIERGMFINRSGPALEEMLHYVHFPDGSVDHDNAKVTLDPTAAGENHGDRVIADAVAWRMAMRPEAIKLKDNEEVAPVEAPMYSMAWRLALHDKKEEDPWL